MCERNALHGVALVLHMFEAHAALSQDARLECFTRPSRTIWRHKGKRLLDLSSSEGHDRADGLDEVHEAQPLLLHCHSNPT